MSLNDLPDGATVYVDANIFVYDFTGQSTECATLLLRTKASDVTAVTGAQVITETVHRLMAIEAVERGLITAGNTAHQATIGLWVALMRRTPGKVMKIFYRQKKVLIRCVLTHHEYDRGRWKDDCGD